MTSILGISAFYHDSAAALVVDGRIVAAAQEERFTRKKHDPRFPQAAVDYCLAEAGIHAADLDYVGFYDKPFLKFERLLETYLAYAPLGIRSFFRAMPLWFREKLHLPREMSRGLGHAYKNKFVFIEHHESHAASAFFPSPFEKAAVLTLDGVGEWATASFGIGLDNRIVLKGELRFPHSLGLLYSAFTYFTGFRVNSGEYKLMGLAPYGRPIYVDRMLENLLDLKADGSFRLDMSYFNYCQGLTMTNSKMAKLFGRPPRKPESPLTQDDMDIAASIQQVTEMIMLRIAEHVHRETGMENLCLAGGVALNCVGNGKILREGPFKNIWIQPAAGDAGGALGTALFIWHQLLGNSRNVESLDSQQGSFLGPQYNENETRAFFDSQNASYHQMADDEQLCQTVSRLLAEGKVVGWMQGRMEFGPRALGGRSILGDPRSRTMQSVMNRKIKFRESFRPFAPSVLKEKANAFFEIDSGLESPYMLLVADIQSDCRSPLSDQDAACEGLEKLKVCRSELPAVTHVDYSARVQTVDADRHKKYYKLLKMFEAQTGCPVLINTSFNVRGEPVVCTPEDAYHCFLGTHMDVLVVENFVLFKEEQPDADTHIRDEYLADFPLD
ncbi:MAG: hypothetical protein CBB70_12545 [Planctomycetaceae bacterium TMED10]|nr:MAG: hypothetical protein CBB70_12545 [Planctomycetaceae bacterium TMED10]